ncbi:MAG TPA: YncE family protein [Candidatus Dormibacteraeota bacterium]|nr:YncE family protein [Candidatus Dormibacteraeota bacterium]
MVSRVLKLSPAALLLAVLCLPLGVAAASANTYLALPNLCSKLPQAAITAALGSPATGTPSVTAPGTPNAVASCSYGGGALILRVGYVSTGAPPHEGGTSTAVPSLGPSGNLTTYGFSTSEIAYLTFMTGPLTRPLYGTAYTTGDPLYRVGLAKLSPLGALLYTLASDDFTSAELTGYRAPAPAYQVVVFNTRLPQLVVLDPADGHERLVTLHLGATASVPNGQLAQLAYSPASPYVYVTASTATGMGELLVVNLATGQLFGPPVRLGLNSNPQGVVVGPGAQFAYVVEESTATLAVVNLSDRQFTAVHLGDPSTMDPEGAAISPDGQQVYVADNRLPQISVIQTSNDTVSTIKLPKGTNPFALVESPDGQRLWVANSNGGTAGQVSEINLSDHRVRSLPIGPLTPVGMGITPDGSKVFVSHQWNSLGMITTQTGADTEVGTDGVPVTAGVAVSPDGRYVILAGSGIQFGDGLVIFDIADGASWTFPLGEVPGEVYAVPVVARQGLTVSSLASSLNTPWRAFRSPQLAAANLAITIPLVLLVTFPSSLFNHTFQENYEEIRELAERRLRMLRRLRERYSKPTDRRFATWLFGGTLAVGAVLDSLLSPNFGLNGTSVVSFLATAVAILVSLMVVPLVDYFYRRRRGLDRSWQFHAIPMGLAVAAICVFMSRLSGFQPGYFYGLVCGVVFASQLRRNQQGHVAAMGALAYLSIGVVAWFLWALIRGPAQFPGAAPPLIFLDDLLASVFVGGVVGNVLALLPLRFTPGGTVASWHKGAWAAVFGIALFGVIQIFLHPEPGAVHVGNSPLVTVIVLFAVFGLGSVGLHRYFLWEERPSRTRVVPSGGGATAPDPALPGVSPGLEAAEEGGAGVPPPR